MSNKKECLDASFAHPTFNLRHPLVKSIAIKITERDGDIEKVLEFATTEDCAAYKRIEAEPLITDKQKYDAVLRSDRISSEDTIKRLYDIVDLLSKSSSI